MMRPTRVEPVKLTRRTAVWPISVSTIVCGVVRRVGHDVDDAVAEARFGEALADQAMHAGADLRRLEDDGVAARERHRHRAHAEDHRRVPRRDAEHDADRLAERHGEIARHVGGMTSPEICVVMAAASRSMPAAR